MKKKQNKSYQIHTTSDMEYSKVIKIALGVLLVLGLTYFVTAIATGEIKFGNKDQEEKAETVIQYDEILAGEIFNRSQEEYYVLLFNFTDTFASYYLSLKDTYTEQENALPIYIVDLEKHPNKEYAVEEGETYAEYPDTIDDLKASNPTLIKIRNHKVTERISGRDRILEFFHQE